MFLPSDLPLPMASGDKKDHIFLSDDIILLILSRLPFKYLYRLKLLSKQWLALVTNHILPQALSRRLIGFYLSIKEIAGKGGCYGYNRMPRFQQMACNDRMEDIPKGMVDMALSFLPAGAQHRGTIILDCCNGLVLCLDTFQRIFYVCNPVTKSCDSVSAESGYPWIPRYCKLSFDPLVSRHYKLVGGGTDTEGCTKDLVVFSCSSSDSGVWKRKVLQCSMGFWMKSSTFCNGALFLTCSNHIRGYVVRIDLLTDDCQLIELPSNVMARKSRYFAIGNMMGKVCHTDFNSERCLLRVWVLREDQDDVTAPWKMVHERIILAHDDKHQVLAFHPFEEIIYFLMSSRIFAYDLNCGSWKETCLLGTKNYSVTRLNAFPFFLVL